MDKTLNCLIKFYASFQNETAIVDYGDNITEEVKIRGSVQSYAIPITLTSYVINDKSSFLLLTNEFRNDTSLSGFELNAALSGAITVQVFFKQIFKQLFKQKKLIFIISRLLIQAIVE